MPVDRADTEEPRTMHGNYASGMGTTTPTAAPDRTADDTTPRGTTGTEPARNGSDRTGIDPERLRTGVPLGIPTWKLSTEPKRWVGYVRVSTDAQVRDGDGLETQVDQLLAWARQHGETLVAIYGDPGISGAIEHLPKRAGLWNAIDDATRTWRAHGIVVAKIDRLARDFWGQEMLLHDLHTKWGLEATSCAPGEAEALASDTDPQRRLLRQILGIFAEYERYTIKQRMVIGRRRKIAAGGYGGGSIAYGKQLVDGKVIDEPHERRMLGVGLTLRGMGVTWDAIAQYYNEVGFRPRAGGVWTRQKTQKILTKLVGAIPPRPLDELAENYVIHPRTDLRVQSGPRGYLRLDP